MIAAELEKTRKQLLDLTTRNRLLSIPQHERARVIRIEDELSDEVLRILVRERRRFSFLARDSEEDLPAPNPGDTKLQTYLSPKLLHKRLYSFYLDARTAIEEQGVNTLYLALGQLQWRDDRNSETDRFAPLLLVPVELQRTNARESFRLAALEQEPSENLSLIARLAEMGIRLPEFEWNDDIIPSDYFGQIREAVSGMPGWAVHPDRMVLGFFSFAKFLMYRDLNPENWPEGRRLEDHELISGLIGPGFPPRESRFPDDADLDELVPVERLNHVVDADSSQAIAIEEVRSGNNLIIQGPPGTGKSQSITNLIATAVLDGKKVLFVADKLAALEVVARRLGKIGLGSLALELHSHRASKRSVLEELKRTLGEGRPRASEQERVLGQLEQVRTRLNQHARLVNTPRDPSGLAPVRILGELSLREGSFAIERLPSLEFPEAWDRAGYLARHALAEDLRTRVITLGTPSEHPWRGVGLDAVSRFDQETIEKQIDTASGATDGLLGAARTLAGLLQEPEPGTPSGLSEQIEAARWIASAPTLDRAALAHPDWNTALPRLTKLVAGGKKAAAVRQEYKDRFIDAAWSADLADLRQKIAAHGYSILRFLNGGYRAAVAAFRALLKDPRSARDTKTRLDWLDGLTESRKAEEAFEAQSAIGASCFGSQWHGLQSDWEQLEAILAWVERVRGGVRGEAFLPRFALLPDPTGAIGAGEEAASRLEAFTDATASLYERLRLDPERAFGVADSAAIPFAALRERLALWRESGEALTQWVPFDVRCEEARRQGMRRLVEDLLAGALAGEEVTAAFELAYYRQLYQALLRDEPDLARFDGHAHSQLVEQFRTLDNRRIEMARLETLLKHDEGLPRAGGLGAIGVLKGEMNKRRNHMPIRRLLGATGSAVQAIKPVFMMSPLSVAQFLEPGKLEFDLVIFDEASQVQPVDALGAIARGKRLVVVGDDRQLPPTRFFSRFAEETEEEENPDSLPQVSAGDLESILGLAATKGIPNKMLRWHYRSKHPSLIAVSNYQFYESRLFIIPTPRAGNPGLGLSFRHVPDGVFDRGRTMRNPVEARAVAEAVLEHARTSPENSLGVAAFSVSQRDAILEELERLQQEHPETEDFFRSHPHEPFFVKNLENVQGDERDCIFISVGYGRDASGAFAMNFGPLNRDGGERRLNVLISRAKLRCVVFSSIVSGEIDLSRSDAVGVAALKTFLQYAETGHLGTRETVDETTAAGPLVASVQRALEAEGFEVRPRVGASGFYIDLAVADPENPGQFLLGIECDGAGYHSARSARERDRQRQGVLAAFGWKLHRIWSTDWFNRPGEELRKVLEAIEAARSARVVPAATSGPAVSLPQREAPAEIALDGPNVSTTPYEVAAIKALPRTDLGELPPAQLAPVALQVIETESPVHHSEITARLREAWGLQRAGSRIATAVDDALALLEQQQSVWRDGAFYLFPGKPVVARSREAFAGSTLRDLEHIAAEEFRAGIAEVIRQSHGISRSDLVVGVARLLGFASTSGKLAERVESEIASCEASGQIQVRGDLLVLP